MKRFIFFSKTNWDEAPRLRHQMAHLLKSQGHEVIFFQKPKFFWQREVKNKSDDVLLKTTNQLIHHQLRVFRFLAIMNAFFEKISILNSLKYLAVTKDDVILNFNYDYYFLRDIFPDNKIVTVINDDFVAQSHFFRGCHVRNMQSLTCRISNNVLTVSIQIKNQLSGSCDPELFLPWADGKYAAPCVGEKNSLLIWASLNQIVDFQMIDELAKKFRNFHFSLIGPVSKDSELHLKSLVANNVNVTLRRPCSLDEIDFGNYFAGLMPYRSHNLSTEAVTLANKSLRLMSKGLPLIVHGMPHFLEHNAIFKCVNFCDVVDSIEKAHDNFFNLQADIEEIVNQNGSVQRYRRLMEIVSHE